MAKRLSWQSFCMFIPFIIVSFALPFDLMCRQNAEQRQILAPIKSTLKMQSWRISSKHSNGSIANQILNTIITRSLSFFTQSDHFLCTLFGLVHLKNSSIKVHFDGSVHLESKLLSVVLLVLSLKS